MHIQTVTKTETNDYNDIIITLDDIIMQEDHITHIIDNLKKEESNIDKVMETSDKKKKEEKMKTTFSLTRKCKEFRSKMPIQLNKKI